jgi:hypothetical protein
MAGSAAFPGKKRREVGGLRSPTSRPTFRDESRIALGSGVT